MKPEACYQQCQYCHYTSDPMGKGTVGRVGLILLTRKPAPACARGFRVKTLKPSPWPGLQQQRIHREGKGEALGTQWGICHGSVEVSEQGCSTWATFHCCISSWLQQQVLQGSTKLPEQHSHTPGAVQLLTALKNSIQGSPTPQERHDPTPQTFKAGFSDYFAPTGISPES